MKTSLLLWLLHSQSPAELSKPPVSSEQMYVAIVHEVSNSSDGMFMQLMIVTSMSSSSATEITTLRLKQLLTLVYLISSSCSTYQMSCYIMYIVL